jgi:orotidine-5'-phosphate decarboxylase
MNPPNIPAELPANLEASLKNQGKRIVVDLDKVGDIEETAEDYKTAYKDLVTRIKQSLVMAPMQKVRLLHS